MSNNLLRQPVKKDEVGTNTTESNNVPSSGCKYVFRVGDKKGSLCNKPVKDTQLTKDYCNEHFTFILKQDYMKRQQTESMEIDSSQLPQSQNNVKKPEGETSTSFNVKLGTPIKKESSEETSVKEKEKMDVAPVPVPVDDQKVKQQQENVQNLVNNTPFKVVAESEVQREQKGTKRARTTDIVEDIYQDTLSQGKIPINKVHNLPPQIKPKPVVNNTKKEFSHSMVDYILGYYIENEK